MSQTVGRRYLNGSVVIDHEPGRSTSFPLKQRAKKIDKYCWTCHQLIEDTINRKACKECPRAYHPLCLSATERNNFGNSCPECKNESVNGADPITTYDVSLSKLLLLILNPIINKYKSFERWPDEMNKRNSEVCYDMELVLLKDRIRNRDYTSTVKFFSDAKWIYHNASIVFGMKDPLTIKAKSLVAEMKTRLLELEACVDCFYCLRTDESMFVKLCHQVHDLVWVKLKGHPFWPAKVLKVINKKAHVVFFGSHERSNVSMSDCYPLSKESPGGRTPQKESYINAIDELELHIQYHVNRFGRYQFAEKKSKRSLPVGRKKRKRAKTGESQRVETNIDGPSQNHSSEATMISDSEVSSSMGNNIPEPNRSFEECNIEPQVNECVDEIEMIDLSGQVSQSSEIPGVVMEFSVGEVHEESLNYEELSRATNSGTPTDVEVENVVETLLTGISTERRNLDSDGEIQIEEDQNRPEMQVPNSSFHSHDLITFEHPRPELCLQVSDMAYEKIMSTLQPTVRDVCNNLSCVSNVNVTKLNRMRIRAEQEYENLKIKYNKLTEEKNKMKESVDQLVAVLQLELITAEKKRKESEKRVSLLENEINELKSKASTSPTTREEESDGLVDDQNAATGDTFQIVPSSSNSQLVCTSTQTESKAAKSDGRLLRSHDSKTSSSECETLKKNRSKKLVKNFPSCAPKILPLDETSPTSTCFPLDINGTEEHASKENLNATKDSVSSMHSSENVPTSELQSSAVSSEAESETISNEAERGHN